MILFLTSSPFVEGADRAIIDPANGFLDRLREAVQPGAKCLFVCSDPDSYELTDRFSGAVYDAFAEAGMPFGDFAVLDGRNAREAAEAVAWSDMIVLAGGHVPTQNRFLREIGLSKLLRDYPGVIMGISAGSMNSAAMVYAHPELDGEAVDPEYERFLPGLGLTFVNIIPHYQKIKDDILDGQRVVDDIAVGDSWGHRFYVLPDGSYIYARDGQTELLGEGYCIENGQFRQISQNGDCIFL